jgi:hypothetical protein
MNQLRGIAFTALLAGASAWSGCSGTSNSFMGPVLDGGTSMDGTVVTAGSDAARTPDANDVGGSGDLVLDVGLQRAEELLATVRIKAASLLH